MLFRPQPVGWNPEIPRPSCSTVGWKSDVRHPGCCLSELLYMFHVRYVHVGIINPLNSINIVFILMLVSLGYTSRICPPSTYVLIALYFVPVRAVLCAPWW